jgi:hypothetical protein
MPPLGESGRLPGLDPDYESLRDDARFKKLLARLK